MSITKGFFIGPTLIAIGSLAFFLAGNTQWGFDMLHTALLFLILEKMHRKESIDE